MTTDTLAVDRTSAATSGDSIVVEHSVVQQRSLTLFVRNFMLEDVVDAAMAKTLLAAPENRDRIPWAEVKQKLGL
jgi:hypothetical protein